MVLKLQIFVELNVGRFKMLVESVNTEFHIGNAYVRAATIIDDISVAETKLVSKIH